MGLRHSPLLLVACSLLLQVDGWGQQGQGLAASKVDPRLRNAHAQSLVPVFITLVNQPQAEIQRRVEQRYASRKAFAEARYGRAARLQFLLPGELESAASELDSVTLEIRETAAGEMDAAVRWEQDLMETSLRSLGAVNIQRFTIVNLFSADVPASSLAALESDPAIARISLAERRHSHLNISVPSIGAPAFWTNSTSYSGIGQSVAIVDTGIFGTHPAFGGRAPAANTKNTISVSVPCANASDNTDTVDRLGHGTHVAGIAAAGQFSGESTLYLGVAKDASNIYMVKAGCTLAGNPSSATFTDSDIIAGLQWILLHTPAKIINMSLGGAVATQDDDFLESTIDQLARASDLTFSISAGNNGPGASTMDSPGIAYNILSVAAMDDQGTPDRSDDAIASFSSRGPTPGGRKKPDIAAPGDALTQGILSADNNSTGFVRKRGTSMAAPHIAGAAALLRQAGVTSSLAVKALLINSTGTAAWDPSIGWGYVNLNSALAQVSNTLTGSVSTGAFRLYSGPSGPLTTTLVWDRNPSSALTNLDLSLYDRSGGALAAVSNSTIDNVEKATASTAGGMVVKVKSVSSTGAENFALAGARSGLAAAGGPSLSVSCSGPATLAPNATGTFGCTVHNTGDLEAFGVNSTLAISGGGSGTTMALGTIGPNGTVSGNWNITAPATGGQYTLQNSVTSTSYEESFTASGSVNFAVSACTYGMSPLNHAALALSEPSDSFSVTTTQACAWSATTSDSWITVLSGSGSGNGSATYRLLANSTGSARSGAIAIAGTSFSVTQPCAFCGSNPVPADTATVVSSSPTLSWPAVMGATSYDLALSTTNPPSVFATGITSTTYAVAGPLTYGTKYYWFVIAKNSTGSVQSPTWSFTTLNTQFAAITNPAGGSTLTGSSVTFQWSLGSGVTQYWLSISKVGVGGGDLFNADPGPGLVTSRTIGGLPTDGSTIYVRLYSHIGSTWPSLDYTYTASGGATASASITSPSNGLTLPGGSVNFQWTSGTGVNQYWLSISKVGVGGGDLYNADPGPGLVTSKTITGLPTNGSTIYVRIYSHIGSTWPSLDYTYTAAGAASTPATVTSPANGSTLAGSSVTFQWTTGTSVNQYWLSISKVGVGGGDLYNADPGPGLVTSRTISGLPTDGSTIYVRLYSHIGSTWPSIDYTYTASGGASTPATITSPANGSVLAGASVTFQWTTGTGVTQYWLSISKVGVGGGDLYNTDPGPGLVTSKTITGLPTDGSTIYVRIYSHIGSSWPSHDYTYTAFH